jgi:hypothetical protein
MPLSRKVIKYNSAGLFMTDFVEEDDQSVEKLFFVNRVQSLDFSVGLSRENIRQIGSNAYMERKIISEPDVTLNFEYLLTDGYEENILGLNAYPKPTEETDYHGTRRVDEDFSQRGSIHNNLRDNKNAFLALGPEEFDIIKNLSEAEITAGYDVIGFGNCFLSNYSVSASVGGFAKASASFQSSNIIYECKQAKSWINKFIETSNLISESDVGEDDFIRFQNGGRVESEDGITVEEEILGSTIPSLDLEKGGARIIDGGLVFEPLLYDSYASAISPGGISIKVKNLDHGGPLLYRDEGNYCFSPEIAIQSFDIQVPFERDNFYGFGAIHAYGRKLKRPQLGTISFEITAAAFKQGRLDDIFCDDGFYDMEIILQNNCQLYCVKSEKRDKQMVYKINKAKLENYSYSLGIGGNASVNCSFTFGMGKFEGLSISGTYQSTQLSPCGPNQLMSPSSLEVDNVSSFGEGGQVSNVDVRQI